MNTWRCVCACACVWAGECVRNMRWKMEMEIKMDKRLLSICLFISPSSSLSLFSLSSVAFNSTYACILALKKISTKNLSANHPTSIEIWMKQNLSKRASRMKGDGFLFVKGTRTRNVHAFFSFFKCKWSFMLFNLQKKTRKEMGTNECSHCKTYKHSSPQHW